MFKTTNLESQTPSLLKIIKKITYRKKDKLTLIELEKISNKAWEEFGTMNGDSGLVEMSVREFSLLAQEWYKNNVTKG